MTTVRPKSPPMQASALVRHLQEAVAACHRGDWSEAERLCRLALQAQQDHFDALFLLGVVMGRTGRTREAAELFDRAASVSPGRADAHFNLGVALGELGRHAEALECYARALALDPSNADVHFNRGAAMGALGRQAEALESYDRAIALDPGSAQAHQNRGVCLSELGRPTEALESYDRAIAINPDYATAYSNRGAALGDLNRFEEALRSYERAIALQPGFATAHNNRGIVLLELDRPAEALMSCERAIALEPGHADAWYNRANALRALNRHGEAVASYERALALDPAHASAHWNLADCLLLLGDFERGWREYEWRWKLPHRQGRRNFAQPLWLGAQPVEGRTVLLHAELGLGDTLQFCRYATELARRGAKVVLEVQDSLVPLLRSLEGVSEVVPQGAPLPPFDCHCPLLSLPLAFRTDLDNLPAKIPYLRCDAARARAWQARLGRRERPRVGLVWRGSTKLRNDRRSMALADLLPLAGDWAEWVSLQKEVGPADARLLSSRPDIRRVESELRDFADTAALVELMDLVVTVDTSVAHVAGALGKPVWILLPWGSHDWRWLVDREDSPWYPSARLFRQTADGDWAGVVGRVKAQLQRCFGAGR